MTPTDSDRAEPILLADIDAERQLIGALVVENGIVDRLGVSAADFHEPSHQELWKAAQAIIYRGESATVAVLATAFPKLKRYIAQLPDVAARGASATDCAVTVRDLAARRRLVVLAGELQERAGDGAVSSQEIIADALAKLASVPIGKEAMSKRRVAEEIYAEMDRPVEIFATGLPPLDEAIGGGLIGGKFYGIGARKKVGKSLLLGSISHSLNRAGVRHLFITLEMSDEEVEQRNIGRDMGFNSIRFLTRNMPDLRDRVGRYAATVPDFTLYEHAPGATFNELRGFIGRARIKGIKGVILDYLQLVQGKAPKDTEEYHHRRVAQWLADEARRTGLWVLTAAQLNQDDNVRGGEGLKLASDLYFVLHRNKGEAGAWLEMEESRFTIYQNVGSETMPALWLRKNGPHFSDHPPPLDDVSRPLFGDNS
jgi:replicative DNA helicase